MKRFFQFIRYLPAFYRFWKEWEMHPEFLDFQLRQYTEVINELTGGKLSKTCYSAYYIIQEVTHHFCDDCDERKE